jgi:hypothetical protein
MISLSMESLFPRIFLYRQDIVIVIVYSICKDWSKQNYEMLLWNLVKHDLRLASPSKDKTSERRRKLHLKLGTT